MDQHLCFARTEKGRAELLGDQRTLKLRQRQVLFLIGEAISVAELKLKLPSCQEFEAILEQLWEDGFIGQVKHGSTPAAPIGNAPPPPDVGSALRVLRGSRLEAARHHALAVLTSLVGEQSPLYARVLAAQDGDAFIAAINHSRKLLAAVASSAQAGEFERGVFAILNLPDLEPLPAAPHAQMNGIESAKGHALEVIASLVGKQSPLYARINDSHGRTEFIEAVAAGKKVIASVASASRAQTFESGVLALLKNH